MPKATTLSVKHLGKKLSSSESEKKLIEKTSEKLRRRYGQEKTVMGGSVEKPVKPLLIVLLIW